MQWGVETIAKIIPGKTTLLSEFWPLPSPTKTKAFEEKSIDQRKWHHGHWLTSPETPGKHSLRDAWSGDQKVTRISVLSDWDEAQCKWLRPHRDLPGKQTWHSNWRVTLYLGARQVSPTNKWSFKERRDSNFHFIFFQHITMFQPDMTFKPNNTISWEHKCSTARIFQRGLLKGQHWSVRVKLVYSYPITGRNPNHYFLSPKRSWIQVWANSPLELSKGIVDNQ